MLGSMSISVSIIGRIHCIADFERSALSEESFRNEVFKRSSDCPRALANCGETDSMPISGDLNIQIAVVIESGET